MREEIIVVNKRNELNKNLAYHSKSLFNKRIFTINELAMEALLRNGIDIDLEYIDSNKQLACFNKIISQVKFFNSSKLNDIRNIFNTINTIRKLVCFDEEKTINDILKKGTFLKKNLALLECFNKYNDELKNNHYIDDIGLIRMVINNKCTIDADITILKEFKLLPLEEQLIKTVGNYNIKSIFELYEVDDRNINITDYKNCFGIGSEVSSILLDISKNNYPLDSCLIALADYNNYALTFYDYQTDLGININFIDGLPIFESYPGKLLKQYYDFLTTDNYSSTSFINLINSPYFNFDLFNQDLNLEKEEYLRISKLRLTNDKTINDSIIDNVKDILDEQSLRKISNKLIKPINEFINDYCLIRENNNLDESSINAINTSLINIKQIGLQISSDIIDDILNKKVNIKPSKLPSLTICSIPLSLTNIKKHLYVAGLSSSNYPGSPKENPLLLDCDLKDFNNKDLLSNNKVLEKREQLFSLCKLASGLNNDIHLSYSSVNTAELKNNNPSSLLFELYSLSHQSATMSQFEAQVIEVGYFDTSLSNSKNVGLAYNDNCIIENIDNNTSTTIDLLKKSYSPSAIGTYFNCAKRFYYGYILKIPQIDDSKQYQVIPANDLGSLVHKQMEEIDLNKSLETFIEKGIKEFDEYIALNRPLINDDVSTIKESYIDMLKNGYQMDIENKREILLKEEHLTVKHQDSSILLNGFPDRVEIDENGNAIIVDFKTENSLDNHKQDDIDTCLQVLIYAYMIETNKNIKVDSCQYRILRFKDGVITCKYDDQMKQQLTEKLLEFKESLINHDFKEHDIDEQNSPCKFCPYVGICK